MRREARGAQARVRVRVRVRTDGVGPSILLRAAVAGSRRRLDRDLAAGVSPAETPRHALRAAQLNAPSSRRRLAALIWDLSEIARRPPARHRIEPSRTALALCTPLIDALATRLSGPGPVYVCGLAQLQRLCCDGTGALYTDRKGDDLWAALVEIDAALSGSLHAPMG